MDKAASEGAFIKVVYAWLKADSPEVLQSNMEYLEELSRTALRLHKAYWAEMERKRGESNRGTE